MTDEPKKPDHNPHDWKPHNSSQVHAVTYDPAARELTVRFKDRETKEKNDDGTPKIVTGGHYAYADVSPDVAHAFAKAESAGKFFHANVRGKFEHRRLDKA